MLNEWRGRWEILGNFVIMCDHAWAMHYHALHAISCMIMCENTRFLGFWGFLANFTQHSRNILLRSHALCHRSTFLCPIGIMHLACEILRGIMSVLLTMDQKGNAHAASVSFFGTHLHNQ
jgi:hypothetical protein